MAATLTELRDELQGILGRREDVSNDRLTRAVNFAQERIAREPVHWRELERMNDWRLTADVESYRLADVLEGGANFHELYNLTLFRDNYQYKLTYIPVRTFDNQYWDISSAWPRSYTLWGQSLLIFPRPDVNYRMRTRYSVWPKAMSAPGETSELTNKDGIIVAFAVSHLYQGLGNQEASGRWYTIARNQVEQARASNDYVSDEAGSMGAGVDSRPAYWLDPFVRRV